LPQKAVLPQQASIPGLHSVAGAGQTPVTPSQVAGSLTGTQASQLQAPGSTSQITELALLQPSVVQQPPWSVHGAPTVPQGVQWCVSSQLSPRQQSALVAHDWFR
jgi:hypothetical protein